MYTVCVLISKERFMEKKIAVIYLARINEGLDTFENFSSSYRKHPAGQEHDLVIIYKGEFKKGEKAAADYIFRDLGATFLSMPDKGFDVHAYLYAAKKIPHKFICLFNSYTEILSDNWLKKMYSHLDKPGVGMVGITGSYESSLSSYAIIQRVVWLSLNKDCRFDPVLKKQFDWIIPSPAYVVSKNSTNVFKNTWLMLCFPFYVFLKIMKQGFPSKEGVFLKLQQVKNTFFKNKISCYDKKLEKGFYRDWGSVTTKGGLKFLTQFPLFPNPHIRTNGFMVEREVLLGFDPIENTKEACCIFESGFDGLTNSVLRKGLEVLVVGADGLGYPMEEWIKSNTFRLGKQENLLAKDNQSSNYMKFSPEEKKIHTYLTWGDYISNVPQTVEKLGYRLEKPISLRFVENNRKFSVVIPTRNRFSLLKEAIFSVVQQKYENWELIIFDNASSDPIEEYVASLKDKRIKFKRSEEFLPVTESWNQAISYATGDYIMFLGDDDGLVPNYFEKANDLINNFREVDVIYSALYVFTHPGVFPKIREGYLEIIHNGFFFEDREFPFFLEKDSATKAWKGSIDFKRNFAFNMQAMTFNRNFLEKIKKEGKVFHSPFPDYYLANVAMEKGEKILVSPQPLAIQGISTASFGYTLFNDLEKEGAALLNTDLSKDRLYEKYKNKFLPGPEYQTKYILTMGYVAESMSEDVSTNPGIKRYRRHQINFHLKKQKNLRKFLKTDIGKSLWRKLSFSEKLIMIYFYLLKITNTRFSNKVISFHTSNTKFYPFQKRIATGEFEKLSEIFEMLESEDPLRKRRHLF